MRISRGEGSNCIADPAYPMVEDELAFPGPEDDQKYGKHTPGCVIV